MAAEAPVRPARRRSPSPDRKRTPSQERRDHQTATELYEAIFTAKVKEHETQIATQRAIQKLELAPFEAKRAELQEQNMAYAHLDIVKKMVAAAHATPKTITLMPITDPTTGRLPFEYGNQTVSLTDRLSFTYDNAKGTVKATSKLRAAREAADLFNRHFRVLGPAVYATYIRTGLDEVRITGVPSDYVDWVTDYTSWLPLLKTPAPEIRAYRVSLDGYVCAVPLTTTAPGKHVHIEVHGYLKGWEYNGVFVAADLSSDVRALKVKIAKAYDIHPDRQKLSLGGVELYPDARALAEFDIKERSVIVLTRNIQPMQIFVNVPMKPAGPIVLDVTSDNTPDDLMKQLAAKVGAMGDSYLTYCGRTMDPHRSLTDHGVTAESTLMVVTRTRGS